METRDVARIVNNMAVPPGYKVRARYDEYGVNVGIYVANVANSDGHYAPEYRQPLADYFGLGEDAQPFRTLFWSVFTCKEMFSEADIFTPIMVAVLNMTCHEWREFMRVREPGGQWYAPLHPHTLHGITRWEARAGQLAHLGQ